MLLIDGVKRRTVDGATSNVSIGDMAETMESAREIVADYASDGCEDMGIYAENGALIERYQPAHAAVA